VHLKTVKFWFYKGSFFKCKLNFDRKNYEIFTLIYIFSNVNKYKQNPQL